MSVFEIRYNETYSRNYTVKGVNYNQAVDKLQNALLNGDVDGPDCCIGSSFEIISYDTDENCKVDVE